MGKKMGTRRSHLISVGPKSRLNPLTHEGDFPPSIIFLYRRTLLR